MSFSNNIDNLQKLKYNISDRVYTCIDECVWEPKNHFQLLVKQNISKTEYHDPSLAHKSGQKNQVLNFSFDPESNGDTNAPNGIDPAFFQDQVGWTFNQSHIC